MIFARTNQLDLREALASLTCSDGGSCPALIPNFGGWLGPQVDALRCDDVQVLVRALPGWAEAEADAVAFVVAAEDRLMLALEAPEGTQAQPLTLGALQVRTCACMLALTSTLTGASSSMRRSVQSRMHLPGDSRPKQAMCSSHAAALQACIGFPCMPLAEYRTSPVQEMQRSLFLLTGMARLLGQWQLALPGSLPAARQLAATFLEFAAQARLGERLAFHCPPIDPKEKASAHHEPV